MSKTVILAAGGTGGHMFPARALSDVLRAKGWKIVLITDTRGAALSDGFARAECHIVPAGRFGGRNPVRLAAGGMALLAGVLKGLWLMARYRPAMVVGFGGYPSFAALGAAWLSRRKIGLHEQNCVLGRTNRLFVRRASFIASGFADLQRLPPAAAARHIVTGNPLRANVLSEMGKAKAQDNEQLKDGEQSKAGEQSKDGDRLNLLVLGGSLGARILGDTVPAAITLLAKSLQNRLDVVQQTREEQVERARKTYADIQVNAQLSPFFSDVAVRMNAADLIIARAGASTVSEIAALGKASILIPLAIAMDDHQTRNAQTLVRHGAADIIAEEKLTPERLAALISARLENRQDLAKRGAYARLLASPDAADKLAEKIIALA